MDPRLFSHKLMEECQNVLTEASVRKKGGEKFRRMIAPAQVLSQAYDRVKKDNIIGSTTACVALFDNVRHQLHFSNLGDSGIIVLRHIDSDVAGALKRNRETPRAETNVGFESRLCLTAATEILQSPISTRLDWARVGSW